MDPAAARKAEFDNVKAVIKAIVVPYKEGASISRICEDFNELEGRRLPVNELGFHSPRELLLAMSDALMQWRNNYGEIVYKAKFDADTSHIQEMVRGQKTVPKKRKKRPITSYSIFYGGSRYNNLKPSPQAFTNWGGWANNRPNNSLGRIGVPAGFDDTPHKPVPSIVNNQINRRPMPNPAPHPQRRVLGVSQDRNNPVREMTSNRPLAGPSNNARASAPFLSAQDIKNIKDLLREHGTEGINMAAFKLFYEKKYGQSLDPHSRGFSDLQHALSTISHICKVELHSSRKHYIIRLVDEPIRHVNGHSSPNSGLHKKSSESGSPRHSPKKPAKGPASKPLTNGHAETRFATHGNHDHVIYHSKQVPPEVKARVDAHLAKSKSEVQTDSQRLWSFKLKSMALLMKATEGISIENFSTDYYLNFKEGCDPSLYGYKDYPQMFESLSKELPIELADNYAGDDKLIKLMDNWQSKWIDICVQSREFDALRQMVGGEDVLLPGENIPSVEINDTVDADVWHKIILTSVVNPDLIFVNLLGKYYSEALDTIMIKLKFYTHLTSGDDLKVPDFFLRENFFCVAEFDVDSCWHRVKVVNVQPDRKKVKIKFIDFGGEQYIESDKLRLMKKEFSYLPSQAIRLSLRGIRPKTEKWPSNAKDEVLNFMNRAMSKDDDILCRLHTRKSPDPKESFRYDAEICAKTSLGFIFLHKQLIESGLALLADLTIPQREEVIIPNNDVHRPKHRKPMRVAASSMIASLKKLTLDSNGGGRI